MAHMEKTLDRKLADIHRDPHGSREFILADAKDADMAYGLAAPGQSPEHHAREGMFRTLGEYRQLIRSVVQQAKVDIVLMSASTCDVLSVREGLFRDSPVTPAARANDTTDIFIVTGGAYAAHPSRPFRTATLDQILCGKADCPPDTIPALGGRATGADLGLYSVTFNNDTERDRETLLAYKEFRLEAEQKGFRHFLEVFDPNIPGAVDPALLGRFIGDHIARALAGVPRSGRPIFLKIAYHGPAAMEALARYAPDLVPGILGGSSGTTYDAFHQLWEARKYGARAALYGRKINNSEHQLAFIEFLRLLADGEIEPAEATRAYHGVLQKLGIRPYRPLEEDLKLSATTATGYSGSGSAGGDPAARRGASVAVSGNAGAADRAQPKPAQSTSSRAATQDGWRELSDDELAALSPAQKSEYHMNRRTRVLG